MLCILILFVGLLSLYKYIEGFDFWTKKGVVQAPKWTAIKENLQTVTKTMAFTEYNMRAYKRFLNTSRYIGIYQFGKPMLMVKDPDLLKQIAVKDRYHFLNRETFLIPGQDEYFESNLFALGGDKWRIMRSTLSPAFTSNKMKAMFMLMDETAKNFTQHFIQNYDNQSTHQMKDTFRRFALDVIANCAFGHKCNSLTDRKNDFYLNGIAAANFTSFWKSVKISLGLIHSSIAKVLNVNLFESEVCSFFHNYINEQLKIRHEKNIARPDMLNLLLEARNGQLKHEGPEEDAGFATVLESDIGKGNETKMDFTDVEITAQVMFFFIAGFDTVSSGLSFIAYELALHQEIQNRLREEIDETLLKCNGFLTYEYLVGMKFMDMVISEGLRKWPPAIFTNRLGDGNYMITKSPDHKDEQDIFINKDSAILIPIFAIHRDPQHYPQPEVFDPERFNDENKKNIRPYTYLPFGLGPRNCVGSRFALMELKVLFFHLLHKFEIVPNHKTQIPVKISKGLFNLDSSDGIWLDFKKRE